MNKIIFTGLLLTALSFVANSQTPFSNPYPKTIIVSGSAEMEVVPDEIYVIIDLREYEKKGSGKITLDRIKAGFVNSCKSIGLPDSAVSIASYDGDNDNPWNRKHNKKTELMASIAYQVKFTDSKKMDELVDKLDDDATQNFRIARTSHSKVQEYRKQLKIQAIKAAREKAGYLAEAIHEQVGGAVTINEPQDAGTDGSAYLSNAISQAYMENVKMKNDDANGGGQDFRKIKLRFELNVVFALK